MLSGRDAVESEKASVIFQSTKGYTKIKRQEAMKIENGE
jgi:hypothetical protein